MNSIKELNKNLRIIEKKRISLLNEIDEYNDRVKLPRLKKQYEGKYFTYNNGYNSSDRWTIFIHCKKCIDAQRMICDRFETTSDGKCEFSIDSNESYSLCTRRINKGVYIQALRKFDEKFQSLVP